MQLEVNFTVILISKLTANWCKSFYIMVIIITCNLLYVNLYHSYCCSYVHRIGNFVTDIMLEAMDTDVALLNAGTLRSDIVHPVGSFKLKDLMAILPMIDFITVLKISGKILCICLTVLKYYATSQLA